MKIKELLEDTKEKIIIIDVEATCWNTPEENSKNKNEVIEIGYCDLNGNNNGTIYIKPEFSKVSSYCEELTGISQSFVDKNGISPQQAYNKLNSIFSGYNTWASYGNYDMNILKTMEQSYKGVSIKMPSKHINVRQLFAEKILKKSDPKEAPSNPKDSMKMLGINFVGRNHSGKDDAKNIAILLNKLMER